MCSDGLRPVASQAGCRIAELAEVLRQQGLTLVNYASIREQAVGGFVQVCRVRCWVEERVILACA